MEDMLDWWTVPGSRFGVKNVDFKVEIEDSGELHLQGGDYSERDEEFFACGDWRYVRVHVTPVDREFTDHVGALKSMDEVEWGQLANFRIDRAEVTFNQVKTLAVEALTQLACWFVVEYEEDSEIRELVAPPF